ncbi:hypothetical protein B1806_11915 [Metallibacterium scheffleri]|uniref:Rod shape-determining protein MreD n=2 Tax=Metallibacterium scheffleri TaxID=993689 RepID=A0A4S3KLZ2_9GAMM|nr:hypothetical protein B1806_11915 [Metallibacterium scheffleri]
MERAMPAAVARLISPRALTLSALIALAVATRLVIFFFPGVIPYNFTPVEALGLFGGAWFADKRSAFIVPLAAMAASDLIIGLYPLLPLVYACIAGSVLLGFGLRGKRSASSIAVAAVVSSTGFYLITNFGVWASTHMYPHSLAGLLACYVAGLPFYPATLAGTLLWSAILFGGYALLARRWPTLAAATLTR